MRSVKNEGNRDHRVRSLSQRMQLICWRRLLSKLHSRPMWMMSIPLKLQFLLMLSRTLTAKQFVIIISEYVNTYWHKEFHLSEPCLVEHNDENN